MTFMLARRTGTSRGLRSVAVLLILASALLIMLPASAFRAENPIGISGDVRLRGDKPVAGTFDLPYKNYGGWKVHCTRERCERTYVHKSEGTLAVKLRTYRILEEVRAFDYYALDVKTTNEDRSGESRIGWAKVHIDSVGAVRIIDYGDSGSESSASPICRTLDLGLSGSVSIVGASFSLGTVRLCGAGSGWYVDRRESDSTTVYQADNFRSVEWMYTERVVKVPAGEHPKFRVYVHVPNDRCERANDGKCYDYANSTYAREYKIGTSG